ncbi:30S ribosome-binding factor RbfA [Bifidobacterium samirii]|uniref:Ribosome-binding factor A n=1 Tax=Bifidobacterium samirii TaxID=2306974 RepID=A0A430FX78_9BIFI|nr:30S ribosome-binding factor RbfA [Bifidobacterium samirii]RSX58889.1 ribosome-binding factor A [Bifidobacterium samirii]
MAGTNPRAARIAALIQRVIASSMEAQLHDKRLQNVTITEVRVTNDLQLAKVYWTQLGHEGKEQGERKRAKQALDQAKGRLRALVGVKAGLRLTPQLQFVYDEVPAEASSIEDILAMARKRDEQLAKARETAQYAGDADPYKHPEDRHDDESDEEYEDEYDEEYDDADEYDEDDAVTVESLDGDDSDGESDAESDAESDESAEA